MIEVFYEKLYVDQGMPWFIQIKDVLGNLKAEHKASEVFIYSPCKTVFLPENVGGKRGFIRTSGSIFWEGTVAKIMDTNGLRVPEGKKD